MKIKKKNKTKNIIGTIIILALILPYVYVRVIPSKARRSLPASAKEIQEEYTGCPYFDYGRLLKAKLPLKDYPEFIKNYGLTTKYDPAIHNDDLTLHLKGHDSSAPEWWDMDRENLNDCYFIFKPDKEYMLSVRYQNGQLYFYESKW